MLIRKYRKKIKFGFSDPVFCVIIGCMIVGCIVWIYATRFAKKPEKEIELAFTHQVETPKKQLLTVYQDRRTTFGLKCIEQKSFVNGHDYLIFNPYYENAFKGSVVHDPDCKKCQYMEDEDETQDN